MSPARRQQDPNPKGEREIADAAARRLRCGPSYHEMEGVVKGRLQANGKSYIKRNVLELAKREAEDLMIKVDRAACRRLACTICWFCENIPDMLVQQTIVDDFLYEWDFEFNAFDEY
jgi:hypothetical protein